MFGKNPITKQSDLKSETFKVKSIFNTIQGEGPFTGRPATFVRMGGCNLQCKFCDTDFTTNLDVVGPAGTLVSRIVRKANTIQTKLIVFTGGEPMLQNIHKVIEELCKESFHVQIETNGTVLSTEFYQMIPMMYPNLTLVVSPKTLKISHRYTLLLNTKWMKQYLFFKYLIKAEEPLSVYGLPIIGTTFPTKSKDKEDRRPLFLPPLDWASNVFIQPIDEYDAVKNKANIEKVIDIAMHHGYRISLQMHKVMGVE